MPHTLLLDLDGTLVDTLPDIVAALNRLMAKRGLALFSRAATASMVGDGVAKLVKRAFATRGVTADAAAVADFTADYTAHATTASCIYPGVADGLQTMAAEGWRLAVCTNKPAVAAHAVLSAVGVAPLLAAIGAGDSYPMRKPDPAHLLATLRAAGGEPRRALMGGDHRHDISAARDAGLPSIFAAWGYGTLDMAADATAVAQNFTELVAIARRLSSSWA